MYFIQVEALSRTVPPAVAGVTFLSGGQTEEEATVNLNEINKFEGRKGWPLTFSFGRALQASVIKTWNAKEDNIENAQCELIKRAKANSEATYGKYKPGSVKGSASGADQRVEKHTY